MVLTNPKKITLKKLLPYLIFAGFMLVFSSCKSSAPFVESNNQVLPLDTQLDNLTNQMIKSLAEENKTQIAIMEFPDLNGRISDLGKFIPEELTTRLFKTKRFEVVERQLINKILDEQKLAMTGIVDASSAAQVGKMVGVDAVVTGTITDLGEQIRLNARMISTETAGIFAVASVSIRKEQYIAGMLNEFGENDIHLTNINSSPDDENAVEHRNMKNDTEISDAPENNPTILSPVTQTVTDNVLFEVMDARLTNDKKLIIELRVTNNGMNDREIGVYRSTEVYDDKGRKFSDPIRTIANLTEVHSSMINYLFISKLPVLLKLEFENVDPDARTVSLLKIITWKHQGDVNLRNFPIRKEL